MHQLVLGSWRLLASMGPGSFGTGKKMNKYKLNKDKTRVLQWGPVLLEPGSSEGVGVGGHPTGCGFNGARFFWNREAKPAAMPRCDPRSIRACFNGARFFWNREALQARFALSRDQAMLQWGPVLLEPGRRGRPSDGRQKI